MTQSEDFKILIARFALHFHSFAPKPKSVYAYWEKLKHIEPEVLSEAVDILIDQEPAWFDNMNFVAKIKEVEPTARGKIWQRQNEARQKQIEARKKVALPLPEEERLEIGRQGLKQLAAVIGMEPSEIVKKF